MIKVIILGGGNLALHLANVFIKTDNVSLIQVYNRNINSIAHLKKHTATTNNVEELKKADIYIISVSDSAIEEISTKLKIENALVVHTSGSTSIDALKIQKRKGVFYPLQTFSKNHSIDFTTIPLCLETTNSKDFRLLEELANSISNVYYHINSSQRIQLHTAAVFVNNFVNHLYYIGADICMRNEIPTDILQALIQETAKKIMSLTPYKAQTGPARRGDTVTLKKHLSNLTSNQQEIYKLLTHSIAKTYGKKL